MASLKVFPGRRRARAVGASPFSQRRTPKGHVLTANGRTELTASKSGLRRVEEPPAGRLLFQLVACVVVCFEVGPEQP